MEILRPRGVRRARGEPLLDGHHVCSVHSVARLRLPQLLGEGAQLLWKSWSRKHYFSTSTPRLAVLFLSLPCIRMPRRGDDG